MIVLENINKTYHNGAPLHVLKGIDLEIEKGELVSIMGASGSGKSTLLKIIAGVRSATRGRVTVGEGGKVGYLPQHLQVEDGRTLVEEASRAFEHLFEIERRIAALNEQLTTRTDYESESYMRLIEEVTAISEKFYAVDLTNYQEDVERILLGLGFERSDFTRQTSEFSGGWRMRIELAKLLLQKPDLLLLDEPTNHLDIPSVEWLEDFLKNYNGSYIVISHDRYFLDAVTNRTFEIENTHLTEYKGNYTKYLQLKEENRLAMQRVYDNTQREIKRIEGIIEQQKRFNQERNYVTIASKQKSIDRLQATLEKPEDDPDTIKFQFKASQRGGNDVLEAEELALSFGDHRLFKNVNLDIKRGEKVFLIGPNGCGKTSLLKVLLHICLLYTSPSPRD